MLHFSDWSKMGARKERVGAGGQQGQVEGKRVRMRKKEALSQKVREKKATAVAGRRRNIPRDVLKKEEVTIPEVLEIEDLLFCMVTYCNAILR